MESPQLLKFVNCKILRNHEIIKENLWVRNGKIVDPEKVFFDEKVTADTVIDCKNAIIAPGLIDLQINGAFGHDFSNSKDDVEKGVLRVAHGLLAHGVTSFCPTVITSPVEEYHSIISKIVKKEWRQLGATVLGVHLEGPFINVQKKGAHPANLIRSLQEGFETVEEVYGNLDNVKIVTLAPELKNVTQVIKKLKDMNITVSVGHSMANLNEGEIAVHNGASLITHLFNAMLPFHHRDPGLVGLLASDNIPSDRTVYFGIISDGIHTHPSALRIAYRTHPEGLVLVTDAISPMGLEEGSHNIGQLSVEIRNKKAFITGTNTLCGSIATMIECVKFFREATGCSVEYALEAASLHPALALGISNKKGTLQFGADADFILLTNDLSLISTWIAGECVYSVETVNKGSC